MATWRFFIDVGGTFTDVIARTPDGRLVTHKLLSSAVLRGSAAEDSTPTCLCDPNRQGDPRGFWVGYRVTCLGLDGSVPASAIVTHFDADTGRLELDAPLWEEPAAGKNSDGATRPVIEYELGSGEEAPVLAIRYLMGIGLHDAIGPVEVRLGTTSATNALLERKGARVAFVTTRGFADILKIGYQDRPSLFALDIRKRAELSEFVVEIDERMSATGQAMTAPDVDAVRRRLESVRRRGAEVLAICLLHAHVNPAHENLVADVARSVGFHHVSVSSRVARMERIVPRGDTTVVDAYLSPVIRGYVATLRRSMPQATIKLMTSSGGLVDAARVAGKDTILSGPAGGVIGCAHVTREAGFDRTIGFDMGGTSTDVSRVDPPLSPLSKGGCRGVPLSKGGGRGGPLSKGGGSGVGASRFEFQQETVLDGVRIMTPMLAVETVAAGGGSVCAFDGQKLTVGPRSAGAKPGPACYGRGGPLTVTDVNLFLGRVVPAYFPFRLDRAVVEQRMADLRDRVNAETGSHLSEEELATGLLKIANTKMADAIKRISLAKGFDAADYTLTTFGGAGAQHACAIARMLGISRILCSPYAGVLSAVGLGVADVKRIGQQSVHVPLRGDAEAVTEPFFAAIEKSLRHALIDEGADPARLAPPIRTMDLCYAGQSTLLTVSAVPLDEARARFEADHRRLYGYAHAGRGIEIRVVRVELVAQSEHLSTHYEPITPEPRASARANARIHRRGKIAQGDMEAEPNRSEPSPDEPSPAEPSRDRKGAGNEPLGPARADAPSHGADAARGPCSRLREHARLAHDAPDTGIHIQRTGGSARLTPLVLDGRPFEVPLVLRRELRQADRFAGPAIIIEETSTIVVEPGWTVEVKSTGDILLTSTTPAVATAAPASDARRGRRAANQSRSSAQHEKASTQVDPVQLELFSHRFSTVAERMGTTLRRTALSVNVKERLDFSCAIFTPAGDLVVNAPHIPVHLGGMSDCVKALMEDVPDPAPGDVYITNDPYRGGSHLNDVTVITPVHDGASGRVLFFVASRAHHAEIGGTRPGSMPPDSTSLAEEGVLIRAFPWIRNGRPQHDRLRTILTTARHPSRSPDDNLADVAAQVAANQTGVRELNELLQRFGVDLVHGYMRHIQEAAAEKMRRALAKRPDGLYRFEDQLDDGSPIRLSLRIEGSRATFDFSGTGPVLHGNLNANRAIVTSAVLYCLRCLIDEEIPLNAGVLSPVEIVLPTCFLNPPRSCDPDRCAAVAGGNVETSQRIVDCIFGALGCVAASQGTMNNLLIGTDGRPSDVAMMQNGDPERSGAGVSGGSASAAAFGYYETICGGAGAGPGFHGADAVHTHMTNTRLTDPEVLESRVPVRLVRFAIRRGSGGRGRFHGGCGVIREMEFLQPLDVSILSQRRTTAPYGLEGGEAGRCGRNLLLRRGADRVESLPPIAALSVRPGDRLTIETPGGGGFGQA